jgi:hypothetical protein
VAVPPWPERLLPAVAGVARLHRAVPRPYTMKVRALKRPRLNVIWRYHRDRLGDDVDAYARLPELVRELAPGRSFVDIGCMWGVNGEYAFLAEEAGATEVTRVDVFGLTPEFETTRRERGFRVWFLLGDADSPRPWVRSGRWTQCSAPACSTTTRARSTCSWR